MPAEQGVATLRLALDVLNKVTDRLGEPRRGAQAPPLLERIAGADAG